MKELVTYIYLNIDIIPMKLNLGVLVSPLSPHRFEGLFFLVECTRD
jgi:hypothetical protein